MILRHSLRFFELLAAAGRPDLAAENAAVDGRFRLAVLYGRRAGLSTRRAAKLAWSLYRQEQSA